MWETVVSQESFIIDVSGNRFCIVLVSQYMHVIWHHFVKWKAWPLFLSTSKGHVWSFATVFLQFLYLEIRRFNPPICVSFLRRFSEWFMTLWVSSALACLGVVLFRKLALEREIKRRKEPAARCVLRFTSPMVIQLILRRPLPVLRGQVYSQVYELIQWCLA